MSGMLSLAVLALVPAMIGPLPAERPGTLTAVLCNGGTIAIRLGDEVPADPRDCQPQGCHAGTCRGKTRPEDAKRGI